MFNFTQNNDSFFFHNKNNFNGIYSIKSHNFFNSFFFSNFVNRSIYMNSYNFLYCYMFFNKNFFHKFFNILNIHSKNFIFFYWYLNISFFNVLTFMLFILKNILFVLIKLVNITTSYMIMDFDFILYRYNYLINNLINVKVLNKYTSLNNHIFNYYYLNVKYLNNVDYLENNILFSLLQNRSYYYFYIKYYILTFLYLFYYIELTISNYVKSNCYLFITYSLTWNYYLNSSKMWCEYIVFQLKKKNTIRKLFWYIKKQQIREKKQIEYIDSTNEESKKDLVSFKYPLKGIRILYSGNFKKAKRKKKFNYYVWLTDIKYTGKMPLKQFKFYIDYYSSVAILKRSSIGIKFWLLFNIY